MSYRGRPSKGCESCRARKVKCDETKPICSRCSKSGHECRYRDQADLLFRNQTAFAAQKAEDSWRKRSKSHQREVSDTNSRQSPPSSSQSPSQSSDHHSSTTSHDSPRSETTSHSSNAVIDFNNLTLGPEVQPDLLQQAYERFIYDFVVFETPGRPTGEPSDALWDFIPSLYQTSQEGSCLKTVVNALSCANFHSRCNAPFAQVLAEEWMGKGIKQLQKQIADKRLASSDDTLAAVYLMGVYENLTSPRHDGSYIAHKEGANALLSLRTINQFYSNPISARLYEVSFAQMLIGNLHSAKPPTVLIHNVVAVRQHLPSLYSTSGIYVIKLIHDEATLHAKWNQMKLSSNPPASREDIREMLHEALDLDAEFQAWESTIPPSWRYEAQPNIAEVRANHQAKWVNLILGSNGAPQEIHKYTTLKRCWVWMFYRTARIFLLRDLLEMLNWTLRLPESSVTTGPSQSPAPTDTVTLHIHHAFATTHLVNIIEKSCSAVLGHFTVPIYGKSTEDVVGLRAYTCFWSLGVMDAVMRMGLVPDSQHASPGGNLHDPHYVQPTAPTPSWPASQTRQNLGFPSPALFKMPAQNMSPLYHNPAMATPDPTDFPKLDPIPSYSQPRISISPPAPEAQTTPPQTKHVFESSPPHENDYRPSFSHFDVPTANPPRIDVAARREWIHRLMYYMGTELGIKKGLAVVSVEGYLEKSKASVDALLGK